MRSLHQGMIPTQVELIRRDYVANGDWETFLSYEDAQQDTLVGMLRLRRCGKQTFRPELTSSPTSLIRELHVYGTAVHVGDNNVARSGLGLDALQQHRGYGRLLMEEAERIARDEHCSRQVAVISGVGTRHYYRKLGYELVGPYMIKQL